MALKSGQIRIAVAEDEPEARASLVRMLQHLGHEVVCAASNGVELLDQCARQEVDVAITDLDMPEMDGLAAAEELAAKGIPVILISGHSDAKHVVLEHEPVAVRISKPAAIATVRAAIQQALTDVKGSRKPQ